MSAYSKPDPLVLLVDRRGVEHLFWATSDTLYCLTTRDALDPRLRFQKSLIYQGDFVNFEALLEDTGQLLCFVQTSQQGILVFVSDDSSRSWQAMQQTAPHQEPSQHKPPQPVMRPEQPAPGWNASARRS